MYLLLPTKLNDRLKTPKIKLKKSIFSVYLGNASSVSLGGSPVFPDGEVCHSHTR
jgi:hypothetical protein